MNRTILGHRAAALGIAALVTLGPLCAVAGEPAKSPPAKSAATAKPAAPAATASEHRAADRAAAGILEVYRLRHVDPDTALSVLQTLLTGEKDVRIAVDPKTQSIILWGPRQTHQTVRSTLEMLDQPSEKFAARELKVFSLKNSDPRSMAKVLAELLPRDVQIATDQRTQSLLFFGPPDVARVAEALLLRLDQEEVAGERPRPPVSCEVRIVWLAGGPRADAAAARPGDLPGDLKDVAAELLRAGVKDLRQVGQVVVRTSPQGEFQVTASPNFDGNPARFTASGKVTEQRAGVLEMDVTLSAEQGFPIGDATRRFTRQEKLVDLHTKIVLPPKQYVVLATAPVGGATSAFVIQVAGWTTIGEAK